MAGPKEILVSRRPTIRWDLPSANYLLGVLHKRLGASATENPRDSKASLLAYFLTNHSNLSSALFDQKLTSFKYRSRLGLHYF
jgi:hypothetical protein